MDTYQCGSCSKICSSEKLLKRHYYNVHHEEKEILPCGECGKQFLHKFQLTNHKANVHKLKKCEHCSLQISVANYKRHVNEKHMDGPTLYCDICEKGFKRKTHLDGHLKTCVVHQCSNCTTIFFQQNHY